LGKEEIYYKKISEGELGYLGRDLRPGAKTKFKGSTGRGSSDENWGLVRFLRWGEAKGAAPRRRQKGEGPNM